MNQRRIETAANIAAIIMFALVGASAATRLLTLRDAPAVSAAPADRYDLGDSCDLIPSEDVRQSDRTLLLILHSQCKFCTESMPFYRQLMNDRGASPGVRFTVLMLDPLPKGKAYVSANGLSADSVIRFPIDKTNRISGTPTLLALDASGIVIGVWIGKLSRDQEEQVERVIRGSAGTATTSDRSTVPHAHVASVADGDAN